MHLKIIIQQAENFFTFELMMFDRQTFNKPMSVQMKLKDYVKQIIYDENCFLLQTYFCKRILYKKKSK